MKIVVVEDEDNTREGIIRLIRKLSDKYIVVGEADNGVAGLEVIEREKPDLVIADIKMPQSTGIEMLERLKGKGCCHKTVILTGFSEFEYAKKALQLGVNEYLEKPITADDLRTTLEKIEKELSLQKLTGIPNGDHEAYREQLLARMITTPDTELSLTASHLEQTVGFISEAPIQIVALYLGGLFEARRKSMKAMIKPILHPLGGYVLFEVPSEQSLIALVQARETDFDFESFLNGTVMPALISKEGQPILCWGTLLNLSNLKDGFTQLATMRKWSIVMGNCTVLHESAINRHKIKALQYPTATANKAAVAVSESNIEEARLYFDQWLQYVLGGPYDPQHVIDACVHFVSAILRVIGDIHGDDLSYFHQQEWLNPLLAVQTRDELVVVMEAIASQITLIGKPTSSVEALSPIVQKATRIIKEQYHDGINLEEIAASLHITPVYLSSLFTKEMKKTYSTYVKEIRIKKAKELLVHSHLKAFEIAQKVGYPDAKYFSRVFKEATGMSPGDYQKMNKS